MELAIGADGERREPSPGLTATCPSCHSVVIPKCGQVVTWHWAHRANDCDPWSEGETEWHSSWKRSWPVECREVVIGPHRADVVSLGSTVVEFQHSAMSDEEIAEREAFYTSAGYLMAWIWDVREAVDSGRLRTWKEGPYTNFHWAHPRRSIASCRVRTMWDLGDGRVLDVKKIRNELKDSDVGERESRWKPFRGWGYLLAASDAAIALGAPKQPEVKTMTMGGLFDGI